MILDAKQTTVAYRCPHCGAGIMSAVNVFALSADMIRLKCTCGKSEMTVVGARDGKVRLTVPCMFCPTPHTFLLSPNIFYGKDLFAMQCPYSGMGIACVGEINQVKAELARSELELLDYLEKLGLDCEGFLGVNADGDGGKSSLSDVQIREIVMYVINEMDAEGKIYCKCDPSENDRQYDAQIMDDEILLTCRKCGAKKLIPADSSMTAYEFLNADSLTLE